jgi:glycolate oxidase
MDAKDDSMGALAPVVARLEDAIGHDNVKTSKMERLMYSHDLAPLPKETQIAFKNVPDIVVRPRNTADVAAVVKIAADESIPITPRGSSTWGLGGSVPVFGGILIDTTGLMNKILKIDAENLTVTAQAGCTWKQVYDACMEKGLLLGSYPSSFPSATLAGWISTGGIGMGNYKYGSAGFNIRDIVVVMPDATVVHTGFPNVLDNMSGYNLSWLIIGAEGTLGVITEVTLKLTPLGVMRPLSYAFPDLASAGKPIMEISRARVDPLHIAFSDGNHFALLKKAGKHAPDVGTLVNVMLEGAKETVAYEEKVIDEIMTRNGGKKMEDAVAQHEWDERCYEFRAREIGLGHIPGEGIVPMSAFSEVTRRTYELMIEYKMTGAIIGIVADKNTVMFMPYYFADFDEMQNLTSFSFNKKFNDICYEFGGRPLGFGAFFATNLDRIRGPGVKYIRDIKKTIDPKDIMNPGKLTGTTLRFGVRITPGMMNLAMDGMGVVKKMMPRDNLVDQKAEVLAEDRAKKERAEAVHQHSKDEKH